MAVSFDLLSDINDGLIRDLLPPRAGAPPARPAVPTSTESCRFTTVGTELYCEARAPSWGAAEEDPAPVPETRTAPPK